MIDQNSAVDFNRLAQSVSLGIASIGGFIAAAIAIYQMIQNGTQRKKELRWRQASTAKTILDEMFTNDHAWNAALMLDSSERVRAERAREYELSPASKEKPSYADVITALEREPKSDLNNKEIFIRDSFDYFFYFIDRIEHYLAIELITYEDVRAPLKRYAEKVTGHQATFENYMKSRGYDLAIRFFRRFENLPMVRGGK